MFGASTAAGVARLYADAGYAAREALPMAEVAFLPTMPARVVSSTAARGRSAADASLVVAAGNPVVVVGQPDRQLAELASEGVAARIANELSGEAFDATFSTAQAAPSGADEQDAAGTPDAASLVVVPTEPLPLAWIGANVRVSVDLRTTDGPVLTVPMAAVRTDGGGRTVVTVVDGDARRDVEVSPGVTGDGFVAVVGPSGSGKSTFLNMLGLLDTPTAGTYRLGGVDTSLLGEDARTGLRGARIGFVFQSFHLMNHRSAVENVELAMLYQRVDPRDRTSRARRALEQVRLGHRADALPSQLSGGERQRVAIARALVNRPSVLLCDEPTGNLDSATAGDVLGLIDDLHADGLTILLITHDPAVAARAGRTLTIRDGRLTDG